MARGRRGPDELEGNALLGAKLHHLDEESTHLDVVAHVGIDGVQLSEQGIEVGGEPATHAGGEDAGVIVMTDQLADSADRHALPGNGSTETLHLLEIDP